MKKPMKMANGHWKLGNQTFKYNGGTHEISIRYDYLYKEKKVIKSPRYF